MRPVILRPSSSSERPRYRSSSGRSELPGLYPAFFLNALSPLLDATEPPNDVCLVVFDTVARARVFAGGRIELQDGAPARVVAGMDSRVSRARSLDTREIELT